MMEFPKKTYVFISFFFFVIESTSIYSSPSKLVDADQDGVYDNWDACPNTPAGRTVAEDGCCSAALGLTLAIRWLGNAEPSQVGDAWVAVHIKEFIQADALNRFIDRAKVKFSKDPNIWYIVPDAPSVPLPSMIPMGILRFILSMSTPNAIPKAQAMELMLEYLRDDSATGYVLTHQILLYEIARSRKIMLPEDIAARRSTWLGKIAGEHTADNEFGDLYAERAMILLLYSDVKQEVADAWINAIVTAQESDGRWKSKDYPISFQGTESVIKTHESHTSVLSAYCLALYLARFAVGDQADYPP